MASPNTAKVDTLGRREQISAIVVATIGTPWAIVLVQFTAKNSYDVWAWLLYLVILGPGFVVYVGLLLKACRRPVLLDPLGTWVGTIVINGVWVLLAAPR